MFVWRTVRHPVARRAKLCEVLHQIAVLPVYVSEDLDWHWHTQYRRLNLKPLLDRRAAMHITTVGQLLVSAVLHVLLPASALSACLCFL